MKQVPRDLLEEIRARSDIVDVIGAHLHLIRAGSRFKALCPFHAEKTPSFHVNPQMQAYHCFGCGVGGDVFRFIMEQEGVDFMTAVRLLAHRAGIPIAMEEDGRNGAERGEKDALYRLHEDLTAFYRECLVKDPSAEPARAYLRERDLDGAIAEDYRFGFAPAQPDALAAWARDRKVGKALLMKGGILATSETNPNARPYDRFHGRLMIPIRDELGRVIGFTGRVLRKEDSPAKYVNSPETPLFRKSNVLFGLDRARKSIADSRSGVLCEGQLDTIRCQASGISNAVAAQGTAVTEDHARILARYADEVVLLLDSDDAGRRAAVRSSHLLIGAGLGVRVALLPEGEDPDTLIRRHGVERVHQCIRAAESAMRYLVAEQERAGELSSEPGRIRASRAALELASQATSAVQREQLLREASSLLGITEQSLREDFQRIATRRPPRAAPTPPSAETPTEPDPAEEIELLEACLASDPALQEARRYMPPDCLSSPRCRVAVKALLNGGVDALRTEATRSENPELARFIGGLLVSPRWEAISQDGANGMDPITMIRTAIACIWHRKLETQRSELRARKRSASGAAQTELEALGRELTMKITALRSRWPQARAVIEAELDALDDDEKHIAERRSTV